MFDKANSLPAAKSAVARGGDVAAEVEAAGEPLRGGNERTNFDTAMVSRGRQLGIAGTYFGSGVNRIIFAQEIDGGPGKAAPG